MIIMNGRISNFRMGKHTKYNNQMIILAENTDSKEKAAKLVGKQVVWSNDKGTEIKGEVRSAHGNKGALRVLFEKGMPGQSIGTKITIQ